MRRRTLACAFLPLLLAGCGGGNHRSSANADTVGPQLAIEWPARVRGFASPAAATAAQITLPGAGVNGSDLIQVVQRPDGAAAVAKTYQLGVAVAPGRRLLRVDFLSDANSATPLATATLNVRVASDGSLSGIDGKPLGTVAFGSSVMGIEIVADQTVEVGQKADLTVNALTKGGIAALAPGSVTYALASGSANLALGTDGSISGLAVGTATITATVDGLTSRTASVTVLPAPLAARTVAVRSGDLAYDAVRNRLWLALPADVANPNSIQSLDPSTGTLGAPIVVGADPSVLAVSDDASTLYVALRGTDQIRAVGLATNALGAPFSAFTDDYGLGSALDIAVQPGHPGTVAVLEAADSGRVVGPIVFDGGVARANAGSTSTGYLLLWGAEDVVHAYDPSSFGSYYTFAVDASGATQTTYGTSLGNAQELVRVGERAYARSGAIFDARTLGAIGTLSVSAGGTSGGQSFGPVVDLAARRAYFLEITASLARIRAFDLDTRLQTASRRIANVDLSKDYYAVQRPRLTRVGTTGLAFRLAGQVVIVDDVSGL